MRNRPGVLLYATLTSGRSVQSAKPTYKETSKKTFYRHLLKAKLLSIFATNLPIFHILL